MRAASVSACVTLVWLGACGFDIPPPSYVSATEIAAVRQQVVELSDLDPYRYGPLFTYDDEMPIAEVLPGDVVRLEAVVIDVDGNELPAQDIETLWLQCGVGPCTAYGSFAASVFDYACSEYGPGLTTDDYCRLGTGSAAFEFRVPRLGWQVLSDPRMSFYGVVAWDGRRVEDCWQQRRGDKAELDRCGFIYQNIQVGPPWWMLAYADGLFYELPYNVDGFPPIVLEQPANRVPRAPVLTIRVDGQLRADDRPPLPTIAIEPGAQISIALSFDTTSQLLQSKFVWVEDSYEFVIEPELVLSRTLTTGAIRHRGDDSLPRIDDVRYDYDVDAHAEPGVSRVFIGYRDDRGANDIVRVDFEVQ